MMFTGGSLLAWLIGLTVLYGAYRVAVRLDAPVEVHCPKVDAELDAVDEFYRDLEAEARV